MATVQQWGRKESVIWPPRGYVYTLGAFIFACILAGLFIYIRFEYGLSPLMRYYLPYYLRTETAGLTHPVSQYQLLYVSDGEKPGRAALDSDVQPGSTPQIGGKPLPLTLTPEAAKHGTFYLTRESLRNYQNKALHAWIASLDLSGCADLQALHDAARLWPSCVRAAAPILNSQGHSANQGPSLWTWPQRPSPCEWQAVHKSRGRERHRNHD
jgi:hypothetical protein